MGPDDGEWIRDEWPPEAGPPEAQPPGDGENRGHGGAPGFSGWVAAAVAVVAAVTGATTITGTARGIGGVKVGDEVPAQITGTAGHLTATAIQDPILARLASACS